MNIATLDEFMALNDELAALAQARVPLDLNLGTPGADVAATLEKINSSVARRMSQGATLDAALSSADGSIPESYRAMMLLAIRSGNLQVALQTTSRLGQSVDQSWHILHLSLIYPIVLCCLVYLGLILLCISFVPVLERLYDSLRMEAGIGLSNLQFLQHTLAYWIAIPPLALLVFVGWQFFWRRRGTTAARQSVSSLAWVPGLSRAIFQERCANFAETLAALLDASVPLSQALPLAAEASGDPDLSAGAQRLALTLEQGPSFNGDGPAARQFPPFLRWALCHSQGITGQSRALLTSARIYHESALRRFDQLRVIVPIATCVVIGGGVTLLYGLALFMPVVELLRGLA